MHIEILSRDDDGFEAVATPPDPRDLASEAWHGGQMLRDHLRRLGAAAELANIAYWARRLATGEIRWRVLYDSNTMYDTPHTTRVPEAAFDWPIYRAGLDAVR